MKTGRVEKNRRGMEEDTWKKVPVGEKQLRLIIDHLSTRPPVGGYPRNHYAPLCFQPLEIHPVSWLMSGASSWTASAGGARCFFDLMTRCPTQAWQRTRALSLYLSSLYSSSRISVSIPFRSPLPTTI